MGNVLKAKVLSGRYIGQIVRITNVSEDDLGRKSAACILEDSTRANLPINLLEVIRAEEPSISEVRKTRTASMPFLSGSTGSRSLNTTRSIHRTRHEIRVTPVTTKVTLAICQVCGLEYNVEERKGQDGKITQCEACAEETEQKVEGTMIFSHKTGATIEIKKNGELLHEAPIFDPKNKT